MQIVLVYESDILFNKVYIRFKKKSKNVCESEKVDFIDREPVQIF